MNQVVLNLKVLVKKFRRIRLIRTDPTTLAAA